MIESTYYNKFYAAKSQLIQNLDQLAHYINQILYYNMSKMQYGASGVDFAYKFTRDIILYAVKLLRSRLVASSNGLIDTIIRNYVYQTSSVSSQNYIYRKDTDVDYLQSCIIEMDRSYFPYLWRRG